MTRGDGALLPHALEALQAVHAAGVVHGEFVNAVTVSTAVVTFFFSARLHVGLVIHNFFGCYSLCSWMRWRWYCNLGI